MSRSWRRKEEGPIVADRVFKTREQAIDEVRKIEAQQEILDALRESECEEAYYVRD